MAVGAYTVALLIGNEHWALVPALARCRAGRRRVVGIPVGRRRHPPARPVPCRRDARVRRRPAGAADQLPGDVRRRERPRRSTRRPPPSCARRELPARALGGVDRLRRRADRAVRALQPHRAAASGASLRAVRDDEIAAVAVRAARRAHADARVRGQRRLRRPRRRPARGRPAARARRARSRSQLSLSLLTGDRPRRPRVARRRGLGRGAAGAAADAGPTTSPTRSRSSTSVRANLPLAIYGLVLIGADARVAERDPGRRRRSLALARSSAVTSRQLQEEERMYSAPDSPGAAVASACVGAGRRAAARRAPAAGRSAAAPGRDRHEHHVRDPPAADRAGGAGLQRDRARLAGVLRLRQRPRRRVTAARSI